MWYWLISEYIYLYLGFNSHSSIVFVITNYGIVGIDIQLVWH